MSASSRTPRPRRDTNARAGRSAAPPKASDPARTLVGAIFARPGGWVALGLVLVTLAAYAPVFGHRFVNFDDPGYVTENPEVAAGLTARGVAWAFTTSDMFNWHPVTWLSHLLDVTLFGVSPGAHHATSLLFHVVNALLLFGLLRKTTGALGRSAFVAGLFALHPLHVESVAWVSERKDVLSTFFMLLTINAYAGYARAPSPRRYLGVAALYALGLMSKPMLVTLPFALLLLDCWPLTRVPLAWSRLAAEKLPLLALAAASSVATYLAQARGGSVVAHDAIPGALAAANAAISYLAYLGKTIWPAHLAAFYPYPTSIPAWQTAAACLALAALTFVALRTTRARPYLAVGWLWYLGTLVPVIGLVQVGTQAMADRYTYVSLIGVFIAVAWGVADLAARSRGAMLASAAALVLIACAFLTYRQSAHWRDSVSLWTHALTATSRNYVAHTNLGSALEREGRLAEAAPHYAEAVRIMPTFPLARYGLGTALAREGKFDEAIANLREALRVDPSYAEAHSSLGAALANQGKLDEAIEHFNAALRLRPGLAGAHLNLGIALASRGETQAATVQLEEALRLEPGNAAARQVLDQVRRPVAPGTAGTVH